MKKIIALALASLLAVTALTGCGAKKDDSQREATEPTTTASETESTETYTPTFMYFVSAADEDYDAANEAVEALQAEYGDKVIFDIVNVDENPEAAENFSVKDMTPALIMLDTSNDLSSMLYKCSDKEQLKEAIDKALN